MQKKLSSLLFFIFFITLSFHGFSQEMKVSGIVYDSTGEIPLKQALAMAVRIKDSLLLGFTRTNINGAFELKDFPVDTFSLLILHPDYNEKRIFIFGSKDNKEVNIPKIKMLSKAKLLDDVVIYANKNPIYYSGDTLVYVADSFKVGENAVVEDLLKKLPGVKVDKDGKITSQGKSISQVLVDGDEFFGTDPTIATKNLAAKGIETVKVYEKKSDIASDGEDATIQVMDLRLKEDAKKGYFGKISAASDFQQFHEGEILLNKFNGARKISAFGLGSTTPRTNVSRADMNKFGLNDGQQGNFMNSDGQMVWNGNNGAKAAGVPQTYSGGIYYTDKIGKTKQTKIGVNYTYNNYQLVSSSASFSKYSLPTDTSYYSDDSTHNVDLSQTHKLNLSLFSQIDSLTTFEIKPKLTGSFGNKENTNLSDFLDEGEILSRSSTYINKTKSTGYALDNDATFIRKFMKKRRQISFNHEMSMAAGNSTDTLLSYNKYITVVGVDDTINQRKTNVTSSMTQIGKVTYTEPISKKMKMEFEYLYEYGLSTQNKETKDGMNGVYTDLNEDNTNYFRNLRQQNRFATSLVYESRIHTATATVRVRNIDINNENITLDTNIHQNISNILPKFSYSYKPSPSKRIGFNYNTKSTQPSISDLQLVQNNSNPNKIQIGNPDLKPNYEHSLNINMNSWQALSGRYFWAGLNSTITNNAFATSTTYDAYGRTISQTVNVNGNLFGSANVSAGFPVFNKRLEINPGMNASYSKYSNLVNNERNTTSTATISGELELAFEFDSLDFSIDGNYTYNSPTNSISSIQSSPYSVQSYGASLTWTMPWKMKITSDASYTINSQRANGYNINYFVWNASISKAFLKTENLVISLNGNDILNQNISAARTINGNITTDNRTKIISRYFLFKIVYKFNNNRIKEEDARGMWH